MAFFTWKESGERILASTDFHDIYHITETKPGRAMWVPPGQDWSFDLYAIYAGPNGKIPLENMTIVRPMKRDLIATA